MCPSRSSLATRSVSGRSLEFLLRIALTIAVVTYLILFTLLALWVLLAALLLHGGQSVALIALVISLTISATLVWLAYHFSGSRRTLFRSIIATVLLTCLVAIAWGLSSPDQAIFMARHLAWPGGNVREFLIYPQRPIDNPPVAYHFDQAPDPHLLDAIHYQVSGEDRTATLQELISSSDTTSFIIIRDGLILYEGYSSGFSRDSILTSFSIAKSVTSALVGIAIAEGSIRNIDDPVINYLPELKKNGLDKVTIRHLLTMSTGIRFVHKDELPPLIQMLPLDDMSWMTNYPDLRGLALSVVSDGEVPGTAWKYNDFYPQLLGLILERTTGMHASEYLQEKVWIPLGMEFPASWSLDSTQSGFEHMESGLNARAIDFAKFGLLYLNLGNWNGRQLISEKWVLLSSAPNPNDTRPWRIFQEWRENGGYYGYMWWGSQRTDGTYYYLARGGANQQWIYISPSDRLVIVRFGLREGGVDWWPDVFENIAATLRQP